jgi:hypothetical protein
VKYHAVVICLLLVGCDDKLKSPTLPESKSTGVSFEEIESFSLGYAIPCSVIKDKKTGTYYLISFRGGIVRLDRTPQTNDHLTISFPSASPR